MFDKVIGHDIPKKILTNDIDRNKISHAYAFVGPSGIGKNKLAEEFAKKILKVDDLSLAIDYKKIETLSCLHFGIHQLNISNNFYDVE